MTKWIKHMNKKILFLLLGVMHGGFLLQAMELSGNIVPIQKTVNSIDHGTTLQPPIIPFTIPQTEKRDGTINNLTVCEKDQLKKQNGIKCANLEFRHNSAGGICGCSIIIGENQHPLAPNAHKQLVGAMMHAYDDRSKDICFFSNDLGCNISLKIPESITKEQLEKYYDQLPVQFKQTAKNNTIGGTKVLLIKEEVKKFYDQVQIQSTQTANNNTIGGTEVDVTKVSPGQKTFLQNLVSVIFTKQGLAVGSILALIICGVLYKYNKLSFA